MVEVRELEENPLLLGKAFREIREQRGLSVGELARAAGVSEARIAAVENGRREPDYVLIVRLARGIGVRSSAFLLRAEELAATSTAR